jgi:hypothetical protein
VKPDFTVTRANIGFANETTIVIAWGTVSAGFGELTLYRDDCGDWLCDSECMGQEFVRSVLARLADTIRDPAWDVPAKEEVAK